MLITFPTSLPLKPPPAYPKSQAKVISSNTLRPMSQMLGSMSHIAHLTFRRRRSPLGTHLVGTNITGLGRFLPFSYFSLLSGSLLPCARLVSAYATDCAPCGTLHRCPPLSYLRSHGVLSFELSLAALLRVRDFGISISKSDFFTSPRCTSLNTSRRVWVLLSHFHSSLLNSRWTLRPRFSTGHSPLQLFPPELS